MSIVEKRKIFPTTSDSRDRLVVRTLRCGRNNPGSNPGHGMFFFFSFFTYVRKINRFDNVLVSKRCQFTARVCIPQFPVIYNKLMSFYPSSLTR